MQKFMIALVLMASAVIGVAAQNPAKGPDPTLVRDQLLEKEAMHNLEVARQYFKLKKAYRASLTRCEETIAAYPAFSRFDEILYIAGMSSYYLSKGAGKQKPNEKQTPEKLRDDTLVYLSQLVTDYPDSAFRAEAEQTLQPLGGVVKKQP
jgi:outer membrane protein assembly factor BamD (BamD/ComL family)